MAALDAKDLAFRINRDTRFSDDKSPYNPTFRAHISPAGRMPVPVGYFVSVTPGGSFAGGGLFAPHFKDATRMVRDRIAADPQAFLDIVEAPGFAERFRFVGMPLKNVPKGYDPQSPAAEYLKCKCWAVEEHFDDAVVADVQRVPERGAERLRDADALGRFAARPRRTPFDWAQNDSHGKGSRSFTDGSVLRGHIRPGRRFRIRGICDQCPAFSAIGCNSRPTFTGRFAMPGLRSRIAEPYAGNSV